MRTVTLGFSSLSPSLTPRRSHDFNKFSFSPSLSPSSPANSSKSAAGEPETIALYISLLINCGGCCASQSVELFPSVSSDNQVVVREARLEDCWEVAETHCSSFFPEYSFPLDLILRIDRLVGLLSGFSVPNGCMRTCLVAVIGHSLEDNIIFGSEDIKVGEFEGKFSCSRGYVAGILTLDTVADFLPRKGPLRQRRTGIAYISNVAVQLKERRKGIGKRLITEAEVQARNWGCRAIALHCDSNNPGATQLYLGQGFKCIKVPERAKWPQPKTVPGMRFNFMMKLLTTCNTTAITS